MKIAGLEDGVPVVHAELERYIREKEPKGDSYKFLKELYDESEIDYWITAEGCFVNKHSFNKECYEVGHHQAHAANAFYTSNYQESLILTIDGGGIDQDQWTATTAWKGIDNKIYPYKIIPKENLNIGNIWSRVTEQVFELSTGHPYGHSAGTVMATSCLGNQHVYLEEFTNNPYGFCDSWHLRKEKDDEQARYNVAAALQQWTQGIVIQLVDDALKW